MTTKEVSQCKASKTSNKSQCNKDLYLVKYLLSVIWQHFVSKLQYFRVLNKIYRNQIKLCSRYLKEHRTEVIEHTLHL